MTASHSHAKHGPGPDTTNDLRRKAGSNFAYENDARVLRGHADSKITRTHYRAKPARAKPVR